MGFFDKRMLKKYSREADKVIALEDQMKALSDEELKAKTVYFKDLLAKGKTLDDIKIEAFAVAREAARRTIREFPYKVQIIGSLVLHQGDVAEMKTGEGKTLTATMAVYLNALSGKGVHVVTVNEYLSQRDADWMGQIYRFLGLTVGVNLRAKTTLQKREAHLCDITYTTNSELGFDYLRDNMATDMEHRVLRGLNFCLIDEADSILIDESRTPLIISGGARTSASQYTVADRFVKSLKKDKDYAIDVKEKTVNLTDDGNQKAERMFGIKNLYDPEYADLVHRIHNALRANYIMIRDVDYLVDGEGQVQIIDQFTGRVLPGREWSDGLHQAVQAKENVEIKMETVTMATITYQNFFRLFKKVAGMTGTAKTEEEEFRKIYNMRVMPIPTNKPIQRIDALDYVYAHKGPKLKALIKEVTERHATGQPILIGTVSVESSEEISNLLKEAGLPHEMLNAKNHAREADIIAHAGEKGHITLATNMAGRGTDIMLGGNPSFSAKDRMICLGYTEERVKEIQSGMNVDDEQGAKEKALYEQILDEERAAFKTKADEIRALGGLCVFGTERHESRRIDNQLRGRAGRQGDPGYSRFFISAEDELIERFGGDSFKNRLAYIIRTMSDGDEDKALESKMLTKLVTMAQTKIEGINFDSRKNILKYDDVIRRQRETFYRERQQVIKAEKLEELLKKLMNSSIRDIVEAFVEEGNFDDGKVANAFNTKYFRPNMVDVNVIAGYEDDEDIIKYLSEVACKDWDMRYNGFKTELDRVIPEQIKAEDPQVVEKNMQFFIKRIILPILDRNWREHIDEMAGFRQGIGLQSYAQKDPLEIYQREGYEKFQRLMRKINEEILVTAMHTGMQIRRPDVVNEPKDEDTMKGLSTNQDMSTVNKQQPVRNDNKKFANVGPNEPCPCGSGLKFKFCHGLKQR